MNNSIPEPMQKASSTVVYQVYETKNYDVFKLLPNNRNVNLLHVKRLVESFSKEHLVSPIIVNGKLEIIDGQHRLYAAKEINCSVHYIIVPDYGIKEVQIFNANQKNWTKRDFLEMYCNEGIKVYLQFKEFMVNFPDFGMQVCERALTGKSNPGYKYVEKRKVMDYFETGKLVIPDLNKAYRVGNKLMAFKPFYKGFNRGTFCSAMLPIFDNKDYKHNEMIRKLDTTPIKLTHCNNVDTYRLLIEDIWNWRRSKENKISFRYS